MNSATRSSNQGENPKLFTSSDGEPLRFWIAPFCYIVPTLLLMLGCLLSCQPGSSEDVSGDFAVDESISNPQPVAAGTEWSESLQRVASEKWGIDNSSRSVGLNTNSDGAASEARPKVTFDASGREGFELKDVASGVGVRVWHPAARSVAVETFGDYRRYADLLNPGEDILVKELATGVEDYVVFKNRPSEASVVVSFSLNESVAGLRLVGGTLELLDRAGAPRLHVLPPYLVDASGRVRDVELSVLGCEADRNPTPPWDRPVVAPGNRDCSLKLSWDDGGVEYPAMLDPSWQTTGSLATGRYSFALVKLDNGNLVAAGGYGYSGSTFVSISTTEIYSVSTGTWAATGSLSKKRGAAAAVLLNDGRILLASSVYVASYDYQTTIEMYNPVAGTWSAGPTTGWSRYYTESLNLIRLPDGKALLVGDGHAMTFDPTLNSWGSSFSLDENEQPESVSLADGNVLIFGGYGSGGPLTSAELYNPVTKAVSNTGSMISGRYSGASVLLADGRVLTTGGIGEVDDTSTDLSSCEIYDPSTGTWSAAAPMSTSRYDHSATLLDNGMVLVTGGGWCRSTTEIYNPLTDTWVAGPSLSTCRWMHKASGISDSRVAVVGGTSGGSSSSSMVLPTQVFSLNGQGASCSVAEDCVTGHCTDGVCCDTACDDICKRCDISGVVGSCTTVVPPVPTLTLPEADGELSSCSRTLQWMANGSVEQVFDVYIDDAIVEFGTTASQYTVPESFAEGTTHSWKVVARTCLSSESATRSFTILPITPSLSFPADGATTTCNPTFGISNFNGVEGDVYELNVYNESDMLTPVLTKQFGASTVEPGPTERLKSGTYRWNVSITHNGCSLISEWRTFTVALAPPTAFQVTAPSAGSQVPFESDMVWSSADASGACLDYYQVSFGEFSVDVSTDQNSLTLGLMDVTSTKYSDGFESGSWGSWCYSGFETHTGARSMYCGGTGNAATSYGPEIDLTTAKSATLDFWDYADVYGNLCSSASYMRVMSGTTVLGTIYYWYGIHFSWTHNVVDLTPYVGKKIRLAIVRPSALNGCQVEWIIDDLKVTAVTETEPLQCGQNTLNVRAVNIDGTAFSASNGPMVVTYPPDPVTPVLVAPADGIQTNCDTGGLTFQWTSAGHGSVYDFVLDGVVIASGLTGTSYVLPAGVYFKPSSTWGVVARNCRGVSAASETRTISATSSVTPTQPMLTAPDHGATVFCNQTFTWTGSAGLVYDVLINNVAVASGLTQTQYTPTGSAELADGTYGWKVRARNCAGTSLTSLPRSVTVSNAPPVPLLDLPAEAGFVGSSPVFDWSANGAPAWMTNKLIIDDEIVMNVGGETSYAMLGTLSEGFHRWRVLVQGCTGFETYSAYRTFIVDTAPPSGPSPLSPANGAWTNQNVVTLSWNPATDGASGVSSYVVTAGTEILYPGNVLEANWVLADQTPYDVTYNFDTSAQMADWSLSGSWARTSSYHHSGSYGITDSPSGNFGNNWDYKAILNKWFVAGENTSVSYWYLVEMLPWYTSNANDHVGLAVRTRTGNWVNLTDYYGMATGFGNDWFSSESVSLAAYENQEIQIALYIKTDSANTAPGLLIDDLVISNVLQNNKFVPDGVYDWFVSASDQVGNSATGEHFTLGIDRINPAAAILSTPLYQDILGPAAVSFSWSQSSDGLSGVDGYEVWMDGAVLVSTSGVTSTTSLVEGITEGSHQWFVRTRDNAGNVADSNTRNFKIDKTGPETPPNLVSPANALLLDSYITEMCFTAAVDSVSGINRYELYLDGQMYGQVESGQFCATAETPDGTHTWFIRAYDGVGNHTDSTEWSFVIDTAPPAAFSLVSPSSGSDTQNMSPTFCWHQTTDSGSGLDHYELLLTQTGGDYSVMSIEASTSQSDPICLTMPWPLAVGTYDWFVVAYDRVGNQTSAGGGVPWSLTISADVTKPVPVVTTPAQDMLLGSGTFMAFQGSASDPAGSSGLPGSGVKYVRVQIDGVSGTWTNANLSGSVTDAVRYWSWTWMAPTTGTHTLYVTAEDAEGNVSEPVARTFSFDNSGPDSFGLVEPANNAFSQGCPTFSWEPTQDSPGGLSHYVLTITGSGSFVREYNVGMDTSRTLTGTECLPEQSYSWKVTAFDVFGYSNRSETINVLSVDRTGPHGFALTGQTPIESTGWTCNDRSVEVTWGVAADGGLPAAGLATAPYQVYVDGVKYGDATAVTSMSLNGLADGRHTWTVLASDKLGNQTYATANPGVGSFGIDCLPPVAPSLESPESGAALNRVPVDFAWSPVSEAVTDTSSGICSYVLVFDDSSMATVGLETSLEWTAGIEDGVLPWKVAAVDCAGNVGVFSDEWFLTFDSTPPKDLVLLQPADDEWLSTSVPELVWSTAHDQLTGVCSYTVSLDGSIEVVAPLASTWTPSTPLAEGLHDWSVSAVDCAGNAAVPASAVFGVDTVAPIPAVPSMPAAGTCVGSVLPTFLWEVCKDDTSGIDVVKVVVDGVVVADGLDAAVAVATPSAEIADGAHEWSVLCSDLAGNESGSAGSGFVVDTGAPTVAISGIYSQADGSHLFTIEGTAADVGGCGVSNLLVRVGGGAWQTVGTFDSGTGLWQTTLSLYDGDFSILVRATDMAGNVAYGTACSVSIGRCWVSGLCDPDTHICSIPAGQDVTCSTSSQCDTEEHCDGDGQCIGTPILCDDGNPCTDDTCDTARGCVATGNHAACDDGNSCSVNDVCDGSGNCGGVAYSCGETGECEVARECDGNGDCVVEYEGDGTGCSDDDLWCTDDACQQGVCVHNTIPGACVISGQCFDDGQAEPGQDCTACNPGASQTAWTPRASTFVCNDENLCTEGDHCDGNGGCTGASVTCNEAGICEDQVYCDAVRGCVVVFSTEGSFCIDDNPCTAASACDGAGSCVGEPYACVSTACMTAVCDGSGGCATSPLASGLECDDMDDCTTDDQCDGDGNCVGVPSGECQTDDVVDDAGEDLIEDVKAGDEGGHDILLPDGNERELPGQDTDPRDMEEGDPGDFDVPMDWVEPKDTSIAKDSTASHDAIVDDESQSPSDVLVADGAGEDTAPIDIDAGGCASGNSGAQPVSYLLILLAFFLFALHRRRT